MGNKTQKGETTEYTEEEVASEWGQTNKEAN